MAEMYVVMYLNCDADDTPHWCLYTVDDGGDELIFEALGSTGQAFRFHTRSVCMDRSQSRKEKIHVGRIEADVWPEVPSLLAGVPVSKQAGWNCQNWVMQAIEALKNESYLEVHDSGLANVRGKYQKKKGAY
ncbi:hypothetical protein K469DRAFT_125718 [Zopfia rhizophila CBS 207.26]|uniref:Uncharacterized protein n=1 Tax=Zopfia rhizophila CBS 207.26 TaxID=1314779 RepID=A0A6A6E9H7_9PEZI|nr:hypothetical protein K469DRAFT_125718 [Zopfia rhizophila CBS 207.26]